MEPESTLTQSRLKELMHYNPDTGVFTRIVRTANCIKVGDVAGSYSRGYLLIYIERKRYRANRLAFLYMTGSFPAAQTDHINHIRDDNRWVNLRAVTPSENTRNQSRRSNNLSGVNGVGWHQNKGKWHARIRLPNRLIHLGYFATLEEAATARQSANIKYGFHENHGGFQ